MSFNFFRASDRPQGHNPQDSNAEGKQLAAEKEVVSAKATTTDKKATSDKENGADAEKETDAFQERIKKESNSKVECRYCKQTTLSLYFGDEDEKGEPEVSYMHCLNCGFNFPYFEKFEKEKDKKDDGLNWNAGFMLLVAMLFTVIAIRGEDEGLFTTSEPTTIESIEDGDNLRSPQPDPFTTDPLANDPPAPRILNGVDESFDIDDIN